MCPAFLGRVIKKLHPFGWSLKCWHYLSSRAVTRQVLSALVSLTSVFGMGTGGPSQQSTPTRLEGLPLHLCQSSCKLQQPLDYSTSFRACQGEFQISILSYLLLVTRTGFEPMLTA